MCLQNDSRFLITDPKAGCTCLTEMSENFTRLSVLRKISPEGIHLFVAIIMHKMQLLLPVLQMIWKMREPALNF